MKRSNLYANNERYFGLHGVFKVDVKQLLEEYVLKLDSRLFGVSKWYYNFMKRHPYLSLRACGPTSLARAQGFMRESVSSVFRPPGKNC